MSDETRQASSRAEGTGTPFIFLAEDDIDDQEILIETLQDLVPDISVRAETNGRKALAYLQNLEENALPCLIVLDYNLPEADGSEILKYLSEDERFNGVPRVVWSTSNSELFSSRSLALGAQAYFVKPTDLSSINKLARDMLTYCNITV